MHMRPRLTFYLKMSNPFVNNYSYLFEIAFKALDEPVCCLAWRFDVPTGYGFFVMGVKTRMC
jgi:hypothetical protein